MAFRLLPQQEVEREEDDDLYDLSGSEDDRLRNDYLFIKIE